MWLINTASLGLEWFDDPETDNVRYAILSHTWGSEEVSFQDFADLDVARRKAGFAKISGACQLAYSEGYGYAWIDTCCINKQSSAELSEAINSMYRWYHIADVCYALLSDLHDEPFVGLPNGFELLHEHGHELWKEAVLSTPFARCRWFSRGWTLQELIAPSRLVFFDASWRRISDKTTLRHLLHLVTRIDAEILVDNSQLLSKSVWQRMSWVATRETTRTEDIAYCLLGIFDINMPLIYGEGHKAFQRLQEEITRKEGDPSILLWSSEGMPLPQYRPGRYRHATRPPPYRGAFAWAPSEFLTLEAYSKVIAKDTRYDSTHVAVPTRTEMSFQSSCVLQGGVICIMEHKDDRRLGTYFGTYLELQTSKGAVYRPVEKVSDGFVFESGPCGPTQGERLPYKGRELRLLGQHMTMLIDANKERRVCLGIDDLDPVATDCIVWPVHRWEEVPAWWVYSDSEISRVSKSTATVLGVCRFCPQIQLLDPLGVPRQYQLTIACVVGSLPASGIDQASSSTAAMLSRLFGASLVKESNSKVALALHNEMGDKDMDAAVGFMQARLRNNTVSFSSGRSEIVELSGFNGLKKRIRVVCTYNDSPVQHHNGLSWRVQLVLEHEAGFGSELWSEVGWDDVLAF
ncbi:hypothetical protein QQS21_010492 [Conoideocrella luteorostrata]|uniref:Heterokaryon incompatibility domain-containing protein n=1 Tax=Conoideocrella luteorostrata TaxID=1105319 RepID=A0AAJ0FU56_9HYPO|nr:hypothetical protein QQS21_010492 [Conoideocrella luteorostrata]